MRTEQEMLELILNTAKNDARVHAVCMNGSRVNKNITADIWQDFDIVYIVSELNYYAQNPSWTDVFGERTIMQMPENGVLYKPMHSGRRIVYLMQFEDGNRIDLSLILAQDAQKYLCEDKLTEILLNKEDFLPQIPAASDEDYRARTLTQGEFSDCCNEFWWVSTYVAKGLWRNEILYAVEHLTLARNMLLRLLECRISIEQNSLVSIGKCGKYLQKYVTAETFLAYLKTYPIAQEGAVWAAMFTAFELFRETAMWVSKTLGYDYNRQEDERVSRYVIGF